MSPDNFEDIDRRTFVKGAAATGVAATGVTAFSGQAAAQQDVFNIGDVTVVDAGGGLIDVDVTLTNINVDIIDNIDVRVRDVLQNFTIELLNIENNEVTVTLEDIQIANANNIVVLVQALSEGDTVLETERQIVRQ